MTGAPVPVADGLFTLDDPPRLIGAECPACGARQFPARDTCLRCPDGRPDRWVAPSRGTLWSWTVQAFRPVSPPYAGPAEFTPFAVGYVDLDGLCVESIIEFPAGERPEIGCPMEMVLRPLELGAPHPELTYVFRPSGGVG